MLMRILGSLAIATGVMAASVVKADPAYFTTTGGVGGDSLTGSGQWAVITDISTCDLQIFRLNYANMTWELYETVTSILGGTCTGGGFGLSSSLSGEAFVVSAPLYDDQGFCDGSGNADRGAIALYSFDGSNWIREGGLNCFNFFLSALEVAPDQQAGAQFGHSVSIGRVDDDNYLVAVGAPFHDGAGGVDSGKVYVYSYNTASGALAFVSSTEGASAGDHFGYAVTVNQPFVLVGAPGAGTGGVDDSPGVAYVYELGGGALSLHQILTVAGSNSLGREVSLSDNMALVSTDGSSEIFGNAGSAANPNYAQANTVALSSGGDVSQSAGVAFFGRAQGGFEGGEILRDAINDIVAFAAIDVPVSSDYAGDLLGEVGIDIRADRESLFFANPSENRAIVYRYPAGFGGRNPTPYVFQQRSVPCNAVGVSVAQMFGYLGSSTGSGGSGFALYKYDPADPTDPNPYIELDDDYVFTAADAAHSLWIATDEAEYTPIADCNGFTTSDVVPAVPGSTPFTESIMAQTFVALPDAAADPNGGDDFARVMVNMPYPRAVRLADVRYVNGSGVTKTLAEADTDDEVYSTVYIYDPASTIPSGQSYRAVTAAGTPPFQDRIQGYEGFWVRVEQNGANNGVDTHALLIPQPE